MIKVLHSLDQFLSVTENWIYPQIMQVPGVTGAVLCRQRANPAEFPLDGRPIFLQSSAGSHSGFLTWLMWGLARRARAAEAMAALKAYRWHPAILHAHFGTRGWEALGLKRLFGIPLITTFYGYDAWLLPKSHPIWLRRFGDLFRQGDLFLVEGAAMRQRLIDIGCPPGKVRVRPLGVDVNEISFSDRTSSTRTKILMVGRFVEKKGLVDGLKACCQAAKAGIQLDVTIVGDSTGDAAGDRIKHELISIARSDGISGHVTMKGFLARNELYSLLREHDCLLCPSKHSADGDAEGGMPFIITEAQAAGLLCIGTRHCDIPEAIVNGRTGFLFEEGQVDRLTEILRNLPAQSAQLAEMKIAARLLVEEKYNLSKQLNVLSDIYRDVRDAAGHGRKHRELVH